MHQAALLKGVSFDTFALLRGVLAAAGIVGSFTPGGHPAAMRPSLLPPLAMLLLAGCQATAPPPMPDLHALQMARRTAQTLVTPPPGVIIVPAAPSACVVPARGQICR